MSSSDEADEPEFASPHRLASPAALAEYRQYAARVDELREATRARLAETRGAYDEHNALVETKGVRAQRDGVVGSVVRADP